MNEVAVIGGGAAGMMAAVTAAGAGARVTLLERNEKLGKKVYIALRMRVSISAMGSVMCMSLPSFLNYGP